MTTFEARLAHELRTLPTGAPTSLRERVRALGEPEPRRALPRIAWRRATLVLAPACVLALLAAALIRGVVSSGGSERSASAGSAAGVDAGARAKATPAHGRAVIRGQQVFSAAPRPEALGVPRTAPFGVPVPSTTRHQDYEADLRVRVDDLASLGRRTAQAMQVTRELGGYVASVSQSSAAGTPGEADLVLRIPVAHVDDALIRLSGLGTVLEQHVSIVDLENAVQQQRRRIRALRLQIVRLTAALRQSLPADVRLRLQFQLDDARRNLAAATGASKATLREAALSRIALSLTTERAIATGGHRHGRFGNAISDALDFLAAAGAIALAALIVLAPLALVVVLVLWGVRAARRRAADRLLAAS
jgi:Domain of unknown function (DUF4349)